MAIKGGMEGEGVRTGGASHLRAAALPLLVLLLHGLMLATMGDRAAHASFVCLVGAPLLAALACLYRGWRTGWEGWLPLAVGMICWTGGIAATMVSILFFDVMTEVSVSMLLYVLYGVPLIFALASPADEAWPVRLVDGILAAALGYFFFRYVFALSTLSGTTDDGSTGLLRLMFDMENSYIAAFALIRFLACAETLRRHYLRVLTIYAGVYMLAAGYINHFQGDADFGGWSDLIIALPFMLLVALVQGPEPRVTPRVSRHFARLVRAGSPLMLPATLLTVSALLLAIDARLAVAGCIIATLGYGLRGVLVQLRSYDEQDRLEHLSHADALTGVANRRLFDQVLRREVARARRHGEALALMMVDIDHFKQLNDHYGHPVGDERLRDVAAALAAQARRGTDLVARYGGEEFAMILPGLGLDEATEMAEQTRTAIEQLCLPAAHGVVTVSIGLAHVGRMDGDMQGLVDSADRALYAAKHGGRNRIGVAPVVKSVAA
jgi:diguanylate cyclase (GGDEF)-like protein